jgi:transcriptional antiterminator RfaH
MTYWAAARIEPRREALAQYCLRLAGFVIYVPRLRERRIVRGRKIEICPLLFPGYLFVQIELQWHAARWAPGTLGLIMNGAGPAHVPDRMITEIRARERGGLIELPKPRGLQAGDRVRVTHGPFTGLAGLYASMNGHERVAVLLQLLGGQTRVTLSRGDVEAVKAGDRG